ncbi:MAG: response regulator [Ruminococcus sp.]|jgi:signal transduction histidine kinase|nr:response regulator [Ruminococcus sp.]
MKTAKPFEESFFSEPAFNEQLFINIFQTMDAAIILRPDEKHIANAKFDEIMPGWDEVFKDRNNTNGLYEFFEKFTENPDDHLKTIARLRETRESQETIWHFKSGRTYSARGFLINFGVDDYAELWVLRDITEIETQFKIFDSVFETMEDPAVMFLPGRMPIGNSAYSKAFPGWKDVYRFGQVIDEEMVEFWNQFILNPEEAAEQVKKLRETHTNQEIIWHFKNGKELLFKATIVEFTANKYAELWISRDITELSKTKLLFNEIFNVMDPAVAIMTDGTFIANNAYDDIFPDWFTKYNAAITGDDVKDFNTLTAYWDSMITNTDEHIEAIRKLRSTHEPVQSIWHFRDGKECIQKGYWLNLRDQGGELWVLTDVSRLYDAMRRANDASLAKSMFLSSMSHEIRTPMNAIIGMTSLAQKTDDLPRIKRYLEKTEEAGHRLMSIINDVLDMSKIESGKLEISETSFDYKKMIENAVNVIADKAVDKGIEVNVVFNSPIKRMIWADELRLSQVIVNLLSNAVKFTPDCGHITLTTDIIGQNRLRITCTDTGIGISPSSMEKLFNSFEQADKSITRQYGGTGLGLAISKQIVELMGGEIFVESKEGVGSTFAFEIPIEWSGEIHYSEDGSDVLDNTGNCNDIFCGKRILLVEDVEVNRMIVTMLLEETGCVIDEAENGQIAVDFASNSAYNLILMDMQMPVMDGLTATREIRKFNKTVPIIAMTANAFKEDADACINAGMNAHLAKPIDNEIFLALLTEYLKKK